jgi:hypothetical protein
MSHIVSIQTKVRDTTAIAAACRRLSLPAPAHGMAKLYSGECAGLLLQLPGWQYPVVIDLASGTLKYDNFEGAWGNQRELDHFFQMYAVECAKLEARKKGYGVNEQSLADGSIKVQISEGAHRL